MSNDNPTNQNDDGELHVKHERTLEQTESLTVKHQKGGSSNRSNARKYLERTAEIEIPADLDLPSLIDEDEQRESVMDVVRAIEVAQEETSEE